MRRRFLLLAALSATACTGPPPDAAQRYEQWRQRADANGLIDYQRALTEAGVGDVVPMHALLRSSRRWRACDAPEFLLPPRDRATAIVPTLRVVAQLQAMGIVAGANVRSGYRSPDVNRCSGEAVAAAMSSTTRWISTSPATATWPRCATSGAGRDPR